MTFPRTTLLTSSLFYIGLLLLLIGGLALPVAARPYRALTASAKVSYATVLRGRASWYGREHQGMRTSSGERFNRFKYTCAHKTLPFGTRLRVTNIKTGKSVIVRVSDRGPFRHQRILDLAEAAARPLGIVDQGAASIIAQVVSAATPLGPTASPLNLLALQAADPNPRAAFTTYELASLADSPALAIAIPTPASRPDSAQAAPTAHFVVQAGTFADAQYAQAMRARILALDPDLPIELTQEAINGQLVNRVLVNQLDNWLAAETVRRRLQAWGIACLVRQATGQPALAAQMLAAAPALLVP